MFCSLIPNCHLSTEKKKIKTFFFFINVRGTMMMTHAWPNSVKQTYFPNYITGQSGAQTRVTVPLLATLPQLIDTRLGALDKVFDYGSEGSRFDSWLACSAIILCLSHSTADRRQDGVPACVCGYCCSSVSFFVFYRYFVALFLTATWALRKKL